MAQKNMTIEKLAEMINEGFTTTATKEDIQRVEHIQRDMLKELTATHEDVRYLRNTVTMLVQSEAAQDAAIMSLRERLERVERKIGITK
jgi:hypothetical protein